MKSHYVYPLLFTFALLPCAIEAGQKSNLSKPDLIGVVYYLAPSAQLLALDRQVPRPKARLKALGFGGGKATVELDKEKASLRLPSNLELSFVVQLPDGVDPREFQLYPFKVKKGKRELVFTSSNAFGGQQVFLPIQINISRVGQNTYKIIPSSKLAVGEYAFMAGGSIEAFCFGVDRKE
jgi:hypothetical protein